MINKNDEYGWGTRSDEQEKDNQCMPQLVELSLKLFNRQNLLLALKKASNDRFYYRSNMFVKSLKASLNIE